MMGDFGTKPLGSGTGMPTGTPGGNTRAGMVRALEGVKPAGRVMGTKAGLFGFKVSPGTIMELP